MCAIELFSIVLCMPRSPCVLGALLLTDPFDPQLEVYAMKRDGHLRVLMGYELA